MERYKRKKVNIFGHMGNGMQEKSEGGLGIRQFRLVNQAMHMKLDLKIYQNEDRVQIRICKNKYMEGLNSFLNLRNPPKGSSFQNGIMDMEDTIATNTIWEINKGQKTLFWDDKWLDPISLADQIEWNALLLWLKTRIRIKI